MLPISLSFPLGKISWASPNTHETYESHSSPWRHCRKWLLCSFAVNLPYLIALILHQNIWLLEMSWSLSELGFLNWIWKYQTNCLKLVNILSNFSFTNLCNVCDARFSGNWCVPENSKKAPTPVIIRPNAIEVAEGNQTNTNWDKALPNKLINSNQWKTPGQHPQEVMMCSHQTPVVVCRDLFFFNHLETHPLSHTFETRKRAKSRSLCPSRTHTTCQNVRLKRSPHSEFYVWQFGNWNLMAQWPHRCLYSIPPLISSMGIPVGCPLKPNRLKGMLWFLGHKILQPVHDNGFCPKDVYGTAVTMEPCSGTI